MQHLCVLERAGIVLVPPRGVASAGTSSTPSPIQRELERWLNAFQRATASQLLEAFLDTGKWFQVSYGQDRLKGVVNDRRVGGQIYEDWATAPASSTPRSAGGTRPPATRRRATCSAAGSR